MSSSEKFDIKDDEGEKEQVEKKGNSSNIEEDSSQSEKRGKNKEYQEKTQEQKGGENITLSKEDMKRVKKTLKRASRSTLKKLMDKYSGTKLEKIAKKELKRKEKKEENKSEKSKENKTEEEPEHKCSICGKSFDSERGLSIHKAKSHSNEEDESEKEDKTEEETNLKDNIEKLRNKKEALENKVEELTEENDEKEQVISDLVDEIENIRKDKDKLEEKLENTKSKLSGVKKIKEKIGSLKSRIDELESENEDLYTELRNTQEEIKRLEKKNEKLLKEKEILKKKNSKIKEEYDIKGSKVQVEEESEEDKNIEDIEDKLADIGVIDKEDEIEEVEKNLSLNDIDLPDFEESIAEERISYTDEELNNFSADWIEGIKPIAMSKVKHDLGEGKARVRNVIFKSEDKSKETFKKYKNKVAEKPKKVNFDNEFQDIYGEMKSSERDHLVRIVGRDKNCLIIIELKLNDISSNKAKSYLKQVREYAKNIQL